MNIFHVINDWIHITMAVIWIGGIHYHFVILGSSARELEMAARKTLTLAVFKRFTRIVWASIILLVISGTLKGIYLHAFYGLFASTYGWVLGIKLILVAAMIVIAILFTFVYGPQLKSLLSGDSSGNAEALAGVQKKLNLMVKINMTFGFTILLLVVILAMVR